MTPPVDLPEASIAKHACNTPSAPILTRPPGGLPAEIPAVEGIAFQRPFRGEGMQQADGKCHNSLTMRYLNGGEGSRTPVLGAIRDPCVYMLSRAFGLGGGALPGWIADPELPVWDSPLGAGAPPLG